MPSERTIVQSSLMDEKIECPLCSGEGKLKRTEILDRLGVKDFARVAQLSAEEAFRFSSKNIKTIIGTSRSTLNPRYSVSAWGSKTNSGLSNRRRSISLAGSKTTFGRSASCGSVINN